MALALSSSRPCCPAAAAPTARRRAGPAAAAAAAARAPSPPRHAAAASPRRASPHPLRATAADAVSRLAASLSSAEETEDVMLVADVLAEARVAGVILPPESIEAGCRALANGGQFKLHALFAAAVQAPLGPGEPDATARADAARAVLDALREAVSAAGTGADSESPLDLSPAFNRVVRAYARCAGGARLDVALALLSEMVADDAVAVDGSTFGALAASCIEAGRAELAEEVLDLRDYF